MLPHFLVASFFRSCIFFFQKFQLFHQSQPFILVDSVTSSSPTSSTLCPRPFLIRLGPATTLSIYLAFGCPRTWTTQRPLILLVNPPPPTQSVPSSVFSPISYILSSPSVSLPSFSVCLSRSVLCSMCICVLATSSFPRNRCSVHYSPYRTYLLFTALLCDKVCKQYTGRIGQCSRPCIIQRVQRDVKDG